VLGPSLEVARDPRRGAIEQTFGEDAFLVGEMGVAALQGLQGKVLAAATGFAGPALPRSDAGTAPMSERELRSVWIAPFAQAIERAHVAAIVPSRNAIDGIPSHASAWLLRTVLRDELRFTGKVVADPLGIADLVEPYAIATDAAEAARLARASGVDVIGLVPEASLAAHKDHTALASQAAREAIVLLVNDGALPIQRGRLALVGTGASVEYAERLRGAAKGRVHWVDPSSADAVVLLLGDAQDPRIIESAFAAGKPVVAVLSSARPAADAALAHRANALVGAWGLGDAGAEAVAAVLFGDANPSGKLPVTLAHAAGDLPLFHDAKPSSRRGYLFDDGRPLFPFGFGLSYTAFEVGAPRLSKSNVGPHESIAVTVDVRNTGAREGEETVQVYVHDKVSSVTTPIARLAAFAKVRLAPGEAREVHLSVAPRSLALWDIAMRHVVEPGEFEILAGPDSAHLKTATVTVVAESAR
jgi:beta-glucosidase